MDTPALHASMMQPTGLTPAGMGEGIGLTPGMNTAMADFVQMQSMNAPPQPPKNPARERYERLKQVADKLKGQVAGRGLSRDILERLAKIHGFGTITETEMNKNPVLTIAGNKYVDLDILFLEHDLSKVVEVSFKISQQDAPSIKLDRASNLLQENLTASTSNLPWHDLTDFSANLAYLNRLETADTEGNCFDIVDNLYDTFQRIWTEEKKRMKWKSDVQHFCRSNVGRPEMDAGGRLGVRTTFWCRGSKFSTTSDVSGHPKHDLYTAQFAVATGPPAISASQDWLGESVLSSSTQAADIFQESMTDQPAWQNTDAGTDTTAGNDASKQTEAIKQELQKGLNMHFTCDFNQEILLPAQIAQTLNAVVHMVDLDQRHLVAPRHVMQPGISLDSQERWSRTQDVISATGQHDEWKYTYMLYSTNNTWLHPISRLRFSHPQQYADTLPVLRQYALVVNLLRSLTPTPTRSSTSAAVAVINGHALTYRPKEPQIRTKHVKRSNRKPDIASLLAKPDNELPIDVQFDVSDRAHIRTRFPTPHSLHHLRPRPVLGVNLDVLLNGEIEVKIEGVKLNEQDGFHKKLGKVFRRCEDIGTSVAWCIREMEGMRRKEDENVDEVNDDGT